MIANRYRIDAEIGGGMGTVYKGFDTQTQQTVAIKRLKPELTMPELIERFKREGEALRELNHPNIVKMLDTVEENGAYYLIIEYLAGGDLGNLLKHDTLSIERVLQIAIDICDALTRAHRLNIIHRDVKPENVLLAQDGTPRLTDFGVAHFGERESITQIDTIPGTVDYLAPEALQSDLVDTRTDIWALGVLLFKMLTGELPFKGHTFIHKAHAIATQSVPDLESLCPDAPLALVDLVYRMLEKDPYRRVPSVRIVGAELEGLLKGFDLHPSMSRSEKGQVIGGPESSRFATLTLPINEIRHNLPTHTTPFVGREAELAELTHLLSDPKVRLMTILAPGGMGKTRLAIEFANHFISPLPVYGSGLRDFEHGVYLVELAPLRSADDIVATIATTVDFQFYVGGEPKTQLLNFFRSKNMLLVLDNYEHLLEGAALVREILESAPQVKIIATSRTKLNMAGETLFIVGGMNFPDWETPDDALRYSAGQLFMQCVHRVQPQFELTTDNIDYVAQICRLVGGMPLGIELAAAWLEMLTPQEVVAEIEASPDFLEAQGGEHPQRQRSIRAVFEHSWNLLNATERAVLMKLAVFHGSFSRNAAQTVTGASLRDLMALVNKSLLHRNSQNGSFALHELLRQYAEEMLIKSGQADVVLDSYANYYAEFVQQYAIAIKGQGQLKGLNSIEGDFENIQAAWYHALKTHTGDVIQRMIEGVHLFCIFRTRHLEGERLFAEARRHWPDSTQPESLTGQLMVRFTGTREVKSLYERGLAIARLHECKKEIAFCMEQLGVHLSHHSSDEVGLSLLEQSCNLYGELGESFYAAQVLDELGWGYGLFGKNRFPAIQQCLAIRKAIGDRLGTANALRNLATADWLVQGYQTKAVDYLLEAEQISQEVNDRTSLAWTKLILGAVLLFLGEFEEAGPKLDEGDAIAFDIRIPILMAEATVLRGLQKVLVYEAYHEALQLIEIGLQYDNPDNPDSAFSAFVVLAKSLSKVVLGDLEGAKHSTIRNSDKFKLLLDGFSAVAISWFVPPYALILDALGRSTEAIQILSMVLAYPNHDMLWVNRWQPIINLQQRVRQQLGNAEYEALWESGKQLDYNVLLKELLVEFGEDKA